MSTEKALLYVLAIGFAIVIIQWVAVGVFALLIVMRLHRTVDRLEKASENIGEQAAKIVAKMAPAAIGMAVARKLRKVWRD